jgi:transposase InsO family protein
MPWKEVSLMSIRQEFVMLAQSTQANIQVLCRRFGISRKTAYKWLRRYQEQELVGLLDRSRRPHHSPKRSSISIEEDVLKIRDQHPAWGGRKIRARLQALGQRSVPSSSTVHAILQRHGRILKEESDKHRAFQRFEYDAPNALWQMDFKGHFAMKQGRCHPLTVLDDHSRFAVGLQACANEQRQTVQERLSNMFERYGLPDRILADNGAPWGSGVPSELTSLAIWLIRLGIRLIHGRPYHPQTQGKDERFHRTLKAELLSPGSWEDLDYCQRQFDRWRDVYNLERPHQALGMQTPAQRYQPSSRVFPKQLPLIEYGPGDDVRQVQDKGKVFYQGRVLRLSHALKGFPVALRPTAQDGVYEVFFCQQRVTQVDLKAISKRKK